MSSCDQAKAATAIFTGLNGYIYVWPFGCTQKGWVKFDPAEFHTDMFLSYFRKSTIF